VANTQRREIRHTEYHHQWADIQVLLTGEELICAGTQYVPLATDEERKPDLFITTTAELPVSMLLQAGDFAVFLPGEPHQALCAAAEPMTIRKAVFKVPRALLGCKYATRNRNWCKFRNWRGYCQPSAQSGMECHRA
jgi:YhcH/YjgK/YiaL family protein